MEDVEYDIISEPEYTLTEVPRLSRVAPSVATGASRRWLDVSLAVWVAILALLPAGPAYLGLPPVGYVDLAVLPLIALWTIARWTSRGRTPAPFPLPSLSWHFTMAALAGATVLGLMAENHLDSSVFLALLLDGIPDLFRPMNQTAHPLYPLRVGLTFAEGWLVLMLVADLCRRADDPRRCARRVLAGWLAGLAIVSAFAVVQYATEFRLHPYWLKANPDIVRAHATLDDPNALGAYLVLGIGLLIGLIRLGERRGRLLWGGLLVLATAGLATTMSRAALGAALLAPLGVLAFVPPPVTRWHHVVRLGGRLALAAVVIVTVGSAMSRLFITERTRTQPTSEVELVVKTFDPRESADWVLRGRLAWWSAAVNMLRERPLSGIGLGLFPRRMGEYGGGPWKENTHNLFLQLFAEAGIAGGMAFVMLCGSICVTFWSRLRHGTQPEGRAMALAGLIATLGFFMTLLTGHTLLTASGQVLFASFIAIVAALATWEHPPNDTTSVLVSRARPDRTRRLGVLLAVVIWYPAVGVVNGVSPRTGNWGYAWGLFPQEQAGGGITYRWTTRRALLDLEMPPGATTLELPLAAPTPIRGGEPVRVTVRSGTWQQELVITSPDIQTLRIPLDNFSASGRIPLDISVHPPLIPSRIDAAATDDRVLGVQVLRPRFETDADDTPR